MPEVTERQKEQYSALAAEYNSYDHPYQLDPFRRVHWGTVQKWLEDERVVVKTVVELTGEFLWGCVLKPCRDHHGIRDISGNVVATTSAGEFECLGMFYNGTCNIQPLVEFLKQHIRPVGLWLTHINQENPKNVPVLQALGARFVSAKVAGVGSDIYGLHYAGKHCTRTVDQLTRTCFAKFGSFDPGDLASRLLNSDLDFDPTERGVRYGGPKKTWKRVAIRAAGEHRQFVHPTLKRHPVFKVAPELLDLLQMVGKLDDVDYMMLTQVAPEEGMIKRHTDIALDSDKVLKGPYPEKTMRFHFVIQSNPECVFHIWNIDGVKHSLTMKTGEIWYTDVRKPHAVDNYGHTVRVHLVADFFAVRDYWKHFSQMIPAPESK